MGRLLVECFVESGVSALLVLFGLEEDEDQEDDDDQVESELGQEHPNAHEVFHLFGELMIKKI